jgi:hypothetical protein
MRRILTRSFVLLALTLAVGGSLAQTDDPFLKRFSSQPNVDRPEFARFLHGLASSLANGRQSVQLLQLSAEPRPGRGGDSSGLKRMQRSFQDYSTMLDQMRISSQQLLDEPVSTTRLYLLLNAGHRVCSLLDRQIRMAEAYGASSADLRSVISSNSSCAKFRRVAFDDRVVRIIAADLGDESGLKAENRALREELAALEQLLDDLQRIEDR